MLRLLLLGVVCTASAAEPVLYYTDLDAPEVLVPVEVLPEEVRVVRQVFGGAANIPVSGGPFPLRPAVQPARPINTPFRPISNQRRVFGGAANIPVSGGGGTFAVNTGPVPLIRPLRQVPQIEDPNAGLVRPAVQPPRLPAVQPPRLSVSPPRSPATTIGGAAAIPVATGPFPLLRPAREAETGLPQVEDPDAGLDADIPKKPLHKPVVLGPHPVDVPSWVTKPQVEDQNAGIAPEKPKTKPFPVPGTNIGQPKPVQPALEDRQPKPSENLAVQADSSPPQKQTRPFPVEGTPIGQPKPVGELPKTKPFPVPGTNIGQPKPVFPAGAEVLSHVGGEKQSADPHDLETKESAHASPQGLTRPFPVAGTNIGVPRPVGSGIGSTRPFPVPANDSVRPSTRPFPVAGTNIGRPSLVGGPVQAVATGPFPIGL